MSITLLDPFQGHSLLYQDGASGISKIEDINREIEKRTQEGYLNAVIHLVSLSFDFFTLHNPSCEEECVKKIDELMGRISFVTTFDFLECLAEAEHRKRSQTRGGFFVAAILYDIMRVSMLYEGIHSPRQLICFKELQAIREILTIDHKNAVKDHGERCSYEEYVKMHYSGIRNQVVIARINSYRSPSPSPTKSMIPPTDPSPSREGGELTAGDFEEAMQLYLSGEEKDSVSEEVDPPALLRHPVFTKPMLIPERPPQEMIDIRGMLGAHPEVVIDRHIQPHIQALAEEVRVALAQTKEV